MTTNIDISKLTNEERAALLSQLQRQVVKPDAGINPKETGKQQIPGTSTVTVAQSTAVRGDEHQRPVEQLVSRDKSGAVDNVFELPFEHDLLSHDRACLRASLEEWARQASETKRICLLPSEIVELTKREQQFSDLHKWWDSTSYTIHNDWLFTDEPFLTIELVNANGEAKELRLRVSP